MDHVQMTRRRLMANAARAAAGLALVSSCAPARRKQARVSGGFKIGVCDWTIRKTTDPASLVTAKRIGLDGVQVDFGRAEDELPLFD
ncbi:MAG: hypothetical protein ACYTEK_28040, partial [Planctomycetota bacterium]